MSAQRENRARAKRAVRRKSAFDKVAGMASGPLSKWGQNEQIRVERAHDRAIRERGFVYKEVTQESPA